MYECFNCLARAVIWDADISVEVYRVEDEVIYDDNTEFKIIIPIKYIKRGESMNV